MRFSSALWMHVARLVLAATILVGSCSRVPAADCAVRLPLKTALDEYVARPDSSYAWSVVKTVKREGCTAWLVDLTSQTWRTPQEVDRPVWRHWLLVVKPDQVKYQTGMLMIYHGGNNDSPPDPTESEMTRVALATHSVTAQLRMVPNQPLVFMGDGKPREEDDLVAHTWVLYLKTGDPTWPAYNPMVKSVVRAMDTMQALMASEQGGKVKLETFVVTGYSKRGWTTWLTGAVDRRVVAIIPVVVDLLKCDTFLHHLYSVYGFWPPATADYENHKFFELFDSPRAKELYKLVDPYWYRHRLALPKYIATAAGDQFFPPDGSQFYFDDLPGEKYLRTIPNTDHDMDDTDAFDTYTAFYQLILDGKPRPRFSWEFESDGAVRIQCQDQPARVTLWQATNPEARDFRLETLGPKYQPTMLQGQHGQYLAEVRKPAQGWTAWFVELNYPVGKFPLKLTTPVRVIPDVRPFADKIIPGTRLRAWE